MNIRIGDRFEYTGAASYVDIIGVWECLGKKESLFYTAIRLTDSNVSVWAFASYDHWRYLGNFAKDTNLTNLWSVLSE